MTTQEKIDSLQKYLIKGNNYYTLIMIKNDWDYSKKDSYIAMYSREGSRFFSKKNFLIKECGKTFSEAIDNLYDKYMEYKNDGTIAGRIWKGVPKEISE